ncbi:MAG: lysophospholipid acyltransferase family protein [Actinomycetes bacterium]|jgi:1-acyl-sn-glycerol-3-phosphate acyltransferase
MTVEPDLYDALLARGRAMYPNVNIGRPGRARTYAASVMALNALRARVSVDLTGADNVAPGAAILVGNHLSTFDPIVVVLKTGWRVTAFTKSEWFEDRLAPFFRFMGQIPLRRGDEAATDWALEMAKSTLADGNKVGIYPEGTRGPEHGKLYRLHTRVLVPLLQGSPDVAVHAVSTNYSDIGFGRQRATVRISERLRVDARSMSADHMVQVIRDAIVELGDLVYVNQYAFVAKARAEREAARSKDA